IAEALGLLVTSALVPPTEVSRRRARLGVEILAEQADRQVYADGAYINQSHNYHRVILQDYLLAWRLCHTLGQSPPDAWRAAMERSLDFLVAHMNPEDGRLPNHGSNDGSLPRVLSVCDFADFRPTLQALAIALRGERIAPEGPWDEEAAWMLGPEAIECPLRQPPCMSVSFATTG